MHCLRCGRETQEDHVFCDNCLETMEAYPVRPGTAVILPTHKDAPVIRKSRRHAPPSPQDQIRRLKKQRKRLWITVICLLLLLSGLCGLVSWKLMRQEPKPGQNYVVAETTAEEP